MGKCYDFFVITVTGGRFKGGSPSSISSPAEGHHHGGVVLDPNTPSTGGFGLYSFVLFWAAGGGGGDQILRTLTAHKQRGGGGWGVKNVLTAHHK